MVVHAGQPLDHHRYALRRPQLTDNPLASAPASSACSTWASWVSESLGVGPVDPRLCSASVPPCCQRACQTLTGLRGDTELTGDLGL